MSIQSKGKLGHITMSQSIPEDGPAAPPVSGQASPPPQASQTGLRSKPGMKSAL